MTYLPKITFLELTLEYFFFTLLPSVCIAGHLSPACWYADAMFFLCYSILQQKDYSKSCQVPLGSNDYILGLLLSCPLVRHFSYKYPKCSVFCKLSIRFLRYSSLDQCRILEICTPRQHTCEPSCILLVIIIKSVRDDPHKICKNQDKLHISRILVF